MKKLFTRLFLVERSAISLSLFRIVVALTVICVVVPSFCHLADNYFSTAFKITNGHFFALGFVDLVHKSPDWLVVCFVCLLCAAAFSMLIGFFGQLSCIVMTGCCYYFYALNSLHVGTLSWDILLVVLFLMCICPYQSDYFSLDCLRKNDVLAYKKERPFFIQRLLQLQIGFIFFYTGLYKITAQGNWIQDNPIYYLMNYPVSGVTKLFILKDFLLDKPQLCYVIGISIVAVELLMIFLLFYRKTRAGAIYLGIFFHILLILTLDVPATFFFLFPAQLLLFINPNKIIAWIENRRRQYQLLPNLIVVFDGKCGFCQASVQKIKVLDLFERIQYADSHEIDDLKKIHESLTRERVLHELCLVDLDGKLLGGFSAVRKLSLYCPMLYFFIPLLYFPCMKFFGNAVYKVIAKNRYLLGIKSKCDDNSCSI